MAAPSIQTNSLHGTVLERYTNELWIPKGFKAPVLVTDYELESRFWGAAAKTTRFSYVILSACALLATGILAPVYVPLAGICTWLGLDPVYKLYAKFQNKSEQTAARAEQLKAVAHHYQQLQQITTLSDLQSTVYELLVKWAENGRVDDAFYYPSGPHVDEGILSWSDIPNMKENPENLKTLMPAIAWCRFWKDHIKTLKEKKESILERVATLEESDASRSKNQDEIRPLYVEALEIDKEILESKIKKTFFFLIIVKPNLRIPLEEMGDFSHFSEEMRHLAETVASGEQYNKLFKFKQESKPALTFYDVEQKKMRSLAGELFRGLPISEQSFA